MSSYTLITNITEIFSSLFAKYFTIIPDHAFINCLINIHSCPISAYYTHLLFYYLFLSCTAKQHYYYPHKVRFKVSCHNCPIESTYFAVFFLFTLIHYNIILCMAGKYLQFAPAIRHDSVVIRVHPYSFDIIYYNINRPVLTYIYAVYIWYSYRHTVQLIRHKNTYVYIIYIIHICVCVSKGNRCTHGVVFRRVTMTGWSRVPSAAP